jgi:gamma-glutamyltranspeptidase / glutathione hydrolase
MQPTPSSAAAFSFELPYASQRVPLLARQAVATSHPLAAQAGLAVLERGGNAIDAAITVAATLSVVEPTMNGLGSDAFALVWDGAQLHGLNASGRSPRAWSLERFAGRAAIPELGWDAVTVPGAVSGWVALWRRFGSLPFAELLAPAIRYAREGFPVMPRTAALWGDAPRRFAGLAEFARVFLPQGRAPRAGEWFELPDVAASLEAIADSSGEAFYRGPLAERIAAASAAEGGALAASDLAEHEATWVEPIGLPFEDAVVYELPPNGQGLATLIALGILRHLPIAAYGPDDALGVHLQIEAMKLAFAECKAHVADPARMRIAPAELLSDERLARCAEQISDERAAERRSMPAPDHGTVYAATADRQGRMVSFIQSNYLGFGSGVVVPNTGISLQNRGLGFSLDPQHPNCVAGGARPYHTIMPGFLLRDGRAAMSFGVMGGHMQPQGHVQLVLRTVVHHQNPQAICDAPRWFVDERSRIALEPGFPAELAEHLTERGHRLVDAPAMTLFGGAQAIHALPQGYCAGSDPRKDGQAVGS